MKDIPKCSYGRRSFTEPTLILHNLLKFFKVKSFTATDDPFEFLSREQMYDVGGYHLVKAALERFEFSLHRLIEKPISIEMNILVLVGVAHCNHIAVGLEHVYSSGAIIFHLSFECQVE